LISLSGTLALQTGHLADALSDGEAESSGRVAVELGGRDEFPANRLAQTSRKVWRTDPCDDPAELESGGVATLPAETT
jgi:hypothetical protein